MESTLRAALRDARLAQVVLPSSNYLFARVRTDPIPPDRLRAHLWKRNALARSATRWLVLLSALGTLTAGASTEAIHGLPFTRSYPLDEIGSVGRGARLNFDAFGRLAVIQEGVYAVLNDTVWLNLAGNENKTARGMVNVIQGRDGHAYYGTRGSWGRAEWGSDGRLNPHPLFSPAAQNWTTTSYFDDLVATGDGVYFGSWNGIGYWDYARKENRLFELANTAKIFAIGDKVFVSSHERPLNLVDAEHAVLHPIPGTELNGTVVEFSAALDETHVLLSLLNGKLVVFDGKTISPWAGQSRNNLTGRISALQHLAEGGIAVAIVGKGLFILSAEGELDSSLTNMPYHLITDLASREAGVLWVASEDAIEKVLYGGPLTAFGERLGLPVSWPIVQQWNDRLLVCTDGKLYEAIAGPPGSPSRFEPAKINVPWGAWALAASGKRMLVGNPKAIFSVEPDGALTPVKAVEGLVYLVMVGADLCYAIGKTEIALLKCQDGKWAECAPRIPGVKYPGVVHASQKGVWIEMAADGVARLSFEEGRIRLQDIKLPWPDEPWVNVSVIGQTIILTGLPGRRMFFDETTEKWGEAPQLQKLLGRSPFWIARVKKDETGTLWATYQEGIVLFTPKDGGYEMETARFDLGGDRYPVAQFFPGNDVWITTGFSLHHVERSHPVEAKFPQRPLLVSVMDVRNNEELFARDAPSPLLLQLPYERNSLAFRFFSGGYAWRRPPVYQYRLSGIEGWTTLDSASLLSVRELQEGKHLLEVRIFKNQGAIGSIATFAFEIFSPWYRTRAAYALYGIAIIVGLIGLSWSSSYIARRRNRALEKVVHDRTRQLEATMEKLNDETRNAATLAERDRLAGEIHDSLQQGLSGAILQLDSTMKMTTVTGAVRSRLNIVRNMVSYARHEVQHAVWDMESPLLEGTELGDALRKLTALINSGTVMIETTVTGSSIPLPREIKHHLLRIAQEATTNAVRHANARHISIDLKYEPGAVSLMISDDGVGFRPEDALSKKIGHFGLRGIHGRATKLGGKLLIQSATGSGTSIRVIVPMMADKTNSQDAKAS